MSPTALFSTTIYIDSMVALECRPLVDLPWHDIDPKGPILLVVVPQVSREIDSKKRDGRLGQRARKISKLLGDSALSEAPISLRDKPVVVELKLDAAARASEADLADAEPDDADARVVAQVAMSMATGHGRRIFLTQDSYSLGRATGRGISCIRLNEDWLLPPDLSLHEKKLQERQARIAELEAKEPDLEVEIAFIVEGLPRLYDVSPLMQAEKNAICEEILARHPRQNTSPSMFGIVPFASEYDREYDQYETKIVPAYVERYRDEVELAYAQIPFEIMVQNKGNVPAEHLAICFEVVDGGIRERVRAAAFSDPAEPRAGESSMLNRYLSASTIPDLLRSTDRYGRHEMHFVEPPSGESVVNLQCEDFRQGDRWIFRGYIQVDPRGKNPFELKAVITAGNRHGRLEKIFSQPFSVNPATVHELVGDTPGPPPITPIMWTDFLAAISDNNYEAIDLGKNDD